ncbi:hypothetical protein, partial [Streptococcus pneumoniae]|uniref:hypothetical protein n=1 Tax=Streptococcus pneumoniae TaxID=1313 RepID=UPI0018B0DC2F
KGLTGSDMFKSALHASRKSLKTQNAIEQAQGVAPAGKFGVTKANALSRFDLTKRHLDDIARGTGGKVERAQAAEMAKILRQRV